MLDQKGINLASFTKRISRRIIERWNWRFSRSGNPRLTIVSQFFPPDFAATGQLLSDLSNRLAAEGLQVQVLTGMPAYAFNKNISTPPKVEFRPGVFIRRTSSSAFWPKKIKGRAFNGLLFCFRMFSRLLRYSRRGDLLLFTTEPAFLPVVGWITHKLTGAPYVYLVYDLYPDVLVDLKVLSAKHFVVRIWQALNRLILRDAREVIVLSKPMRERVFSQLGERSGKVNIISSWADDKAITPISKNSNWFAIKNDLVDKFCVVYSGNQGRCHDMVTIAAAALALRNETNIVFLFIGSGAQNKRLKDLCAEWCLNNCRFLPYQDYEDLPYSLSSADLALVTLAVKAEGLVAPSKLYGHLAAGTPVGIVSPANSYLKNLVDSYGFGKWFANGDAAGLAAWIKHLSQNPMELKRLRKLSRTYSVTQSSPDVVVPQYMDLFWRHLPKSKIEKVLRVPFGENRATNDRSVS